MVFKIEYFLYNVYIILLSLCVESEKTIMHKYLFFLVLLWITIIAYSQGENDTTTLWYIKLKNNNEYLGDIIDRNDSLLRFKSIDLGTINIPVNLIRTEKILNPGHIREGKYWAENPCTNRYFLISNGIGLKSGEGYYQNTWISLNQAHISVTNILTLGIGLGLVPFFIAESAEIDYAPFWFMPRLSVPLIKEKLYFGAGGIFFFMEGFEHKFGITYGMFTVGNEDRNLSFGAGYGYTNKGRVEQPTFQFNFMTRVGSRFYIISENYFFPAGMFMDPAQIYSMGFRAIAKKKTTQ